MRKSSVGTKALTLYHHRRGWSNRKIAAHLAVDRKSVARWIAHANEIDSQVEAALELIIAKMLLGEKDNEDKGSGGS